MSYHNEPDGMPTTFLNAEITTAQFIPVDREVQILDRSLTEYETDSYFELGIGAYAFAACSMLKRVSLSDMMLISNNAFDGCSSLEIANLPVMWEIDEHAFKDCTALKEINMPNIKTIESEAFLNCTSLERVSIQEAIDRIGTGAFKGCTKLTTVVWMPTDHGFSGLFEDTPIAGGTGYIYVPDDSVNFYKGKGAYVNQIKGISELPK